MNERRIPAEIDQTILDELDAVQVGLPESNESSAAKDAERFTQLHAKPDPAPPSKPTRITPSFGQQTNYTTSKVGKQVKKQMEDEARQKKKK